MFGPTSCPCVPSDDCSAPYAKHWLDQLSVVESVPLSELPFGSGSPNSATSGVGCQLRSQSALPNVLAPCWMARCIQRAIEQAAALAARCHRENRDDQEATLAFSP